MQLLDDVEQQQLYWDTLVARVAAGTAGGAAEFRSTYRPGIHFLLRRRLGDENLEAVVDDTVNEILQSIAQGRLTTIAEMARVIRKVMPRGRGAAPRKPPAPAVPTQRATPMGQTETLDRALAQFNSSEREALVCYYARGFSDHDVEAEFGYDAVAFRYLRERLVRAFHGVRARRGAALPKTMAARAGAAGMRF